MRSELVRNSAALTSPDDCNCGNDPSPCVFSESARRSESLQGNRFPDANVTPQHVGGNDVPIALILSGRAAVRGIAGTRRRTDRAGGPAGADQTAGREAGNDR